MKPFTVEDLQQIIPPKVADLMRRWRAGEDLTNLLLTETSTASGQFPSCPTCFGYGVVVRDLDRMDPDFGKRMDCPDCSLMSERRLRRVFKQNADTLQHFASYTWENYPVCAVTAPLVARIMQWVTNPPLPDLALIGAWGVGKSSLALCAARDWKALHHRESLFLKMPSLLDRIKDTYNRDNKATETEVMEAAKGAPFLVLDDLGAEAPKDGANGWAAEKVYSLVDYRHDRHLPTIFTSNLSLAELGGDDRLGPRITHRIGELSLVVEFPPEAPNLRLPVVS